MKFESLHSQTVLGIVAVQEMCYLKALKRGMFDNLYIYFWF